MTEASSLPDRRASWRGQVRGMTVAVLLAMLAASLFLATIEPAQAAFPGKNGKLVFSSPSESTGFYGSDMYTVNPDGTELTQLTSTDGAEWNPVVSPDGRKLAFTYGEGVPGYGFYVQDIYTMNIDGTGLKNLTNNGDSRDLGYFDYERSYHPTWSPDGETLAFTHEISDGVHGSRIYTMKADGTERTDITDDGSAHESDPAWSPDGQKIAFVNGNYDIGVMNADGTERTRLTDDPAEDYSPAWSPDGRQIAFVSTRDYNAEIYTMDADGTNQVNRSNYFDSDAAPAWSPDGTKIAFLSYRNGTGSVYTMNADGAGQTNLTPSVRNSHDLDWSIEAMASDATAPIISLAAPADGASYKLGEAVSVSYSCEDEAGGSGLESCTGSVSNGSILDTSAVGQQTFALTAKDKAGNEATKTATYRVVYDFRGFFSPVNNLPTLNSVNAGRAIPVKFSLSGDQGLNIFTGGYPKSQRIDCSTSVPVDVVEETVTVGSSGLTYDASTGRYNYVWKTDKAWSGTCRQLVVKLKDGASHQANFQFK